MATAEETMSAARAHANPWLIAFAIQSYGRAFKHADPGRALTMLNEGLAYTHEQHMPMWRAVIARETAEVEALCGHLDQALGLFDEAIDSFQRSGSNARLAATIAYLAVFFDRLDRPELAATIYGSSSRHPGIALVADLLAAVDHMRTALGEASFDKCVARGTAMEQADAVGNARLQIQLALRQLVAGSEDCPLQCSNRSQSPPREQPRQACRDRD
jgi:hypothetical protein